MFTGSRLLFITPRGRFVRQSRTAKIPGVHKLPALGPGGTENLESTVAFYGFDNAETFAQPRLIRQVPVADQQDFTLFAQDPACIGEESARYVEIGGHATVERWVADDPVVNPVYFA